jgi:hypothetical protein
MSVYHLTTPDTDSEASEHPYVDFIPSSSMTLLAAAGDRSSVTDKWLDDVLKYTLAAETNGPEQRNTLNVRRHRVFSTSVESHPREVRPVIARNKEGSGEPREDGVAEEPSSWIAAEIFGIAKAQASEEKGPVYQNESDGRTVIQHEKVDSMRDDGYDDIESLFGDYFEDIKVAGSDCDED